MLARLRAWFRRSGALFRRSPPRPEEQPLESDDEFVHSLLASGDAGVPERAPGWLAEEGEPEAPEARPYLELGEDELARHATAEVDPHERRLGDDLTSGAGRLIDRVLLGPMRLVIDNVGFLVVGAAVLVGLAVATGVVLEIVRRTMGPLVE